MVKVFQVVLTPPPQGYYSSGSAVSGYVRLVIEKAKTSYESITVTLSGRAAVFWFERESISYAREDYTGQAIVLWDKHYAPDKQMAPGSYQFPFALHFRKGWSSLPSSFKRFSGPGSIKYKVEAVLVRSGAFEYNKTVSANVPCVTVVDLNKIPDALIPRTQTVRKTSFLLNGFLLSARIPRSCFCVGGNDAIPLEVDIKNDSVMRVRFLRAKLKQRVTYSAEDKTLVQLKTIASMKSEPIRSGINFSWIPSPLTVPAILPSIATCGIIKLEYYLKIEAEIFGACNPSVKFSLHLGNVPLTGLPNNQPQSSRST